MSGHDDDHRRITIRTATEQDWPKITLLNEICFVTPQTEEFTAHWKQLVSGAPPIIALVEDSVVGATMDIPMTVTVPGGEGVPAAGVTAVTVAPTHRRRGLLRALYTEHHDRIRTSGGSRCHSSLPVRAGSTDASGTDPRPSRPRRASTADSPCRIRRHRTRVVCGWSIPRRPGPRSPTSTTAGNG